MFWAALALRCVPVNPNPRMPADELRHVLDDSDAGRQRTPPTSRSRCAPAARRIPKPWRPLLLEVGEPYEQALVAATLTAVLCRRDPLRSRPTDDLVFLYTNGGTGAGPTSAAMWRNGDLCRGLAGRHSGVVLPAAPLGDGSGLFTAIAVLERRRHRRAAPRDGDARVTVWRAVERDASRHSSSAVRWLRRLSLAVSTPTRTCGPLNLDSIMARGQMFTAKMRRRLLVHLPHVAVADLLRARTACSRLAVGERLAVLDEATMRPVLPGSGEVGLVAMTGLMPVGFWKDAARTSATFRVVDGTRYAFRGDHVTVDA